MIAGLWFVGVADPRAVKRNPATVDDPSSDDDNDDRRVRP
jgi:hypothetical protein